MRLTWGGCSSMRRRARDVAAFYSSPANELYSTKWNQRSSRANNKEEILNSRFLMEMIGLIRKTHSQSLHHYCMRTKDTRVCILSQWHRKCQPLLPFICLLVYFSGCHTRYFWWFDTDEMCRNYKCGIEEEKQKAGKWVKGVVSSLWCGKWEIRSKTPPVSKNVIFWREKKKKHKKLMELDGKF